MRPQVTAAPMPVNCFAPPLSDEKLKGYEALVEAQPRGPVRDALKSLLAAVLKWWVLPESTAEGVKFNIRHRGKDGTFAVTPLDPGHVATLDEHVPWMHELEAMKPLFETIPTGKLRDCAHDLLWHAIELCHDREPLTQDKLPG